MDCLYEEQKLKLSELIDVDNNSTLILRIYERCTYMEKLQHSIFTYKTDLTTANAYNTFVLDI